ncbi:hypothetical protein Tco_1522509 [Tanacetum coccineum]
MKKLTSSQDSSAASSNATLQVFSSIKAREIVDIRNVESTMDITEFFRKLKFICHCANLFKDFEMSNVPWVKLFSFSKSDDTFTSLQALSNLHYLFSGFMDYFWSQSGREMTVTIRDDRYWHSMSEDVFPLCQVLKAVP